MFIRSMCCIVFFLSSTVAQPHQDVTNKYYVGRGEDASLDVARERARTNLIEQIQVLVTSSLHTIKSENGSTLQNSAVQSTYSYSSIMLRDVQEKVEHEQGVYRVTKLVTRSVVQSIFDQRRRQTIDYLTAAEAEGDGTTAVDLQRMLNNYYKAWLMAGLYPDTISYSFRFGGVSGVTAGIPRAMQLVCDNIVFSPSRKVDDEYTTWKYSVMWSGRPLKNLRYTFYDGRGDNEETVKNGSAQATFFFTDKRERLFPVAIQYRETDLQDALLAIADSMRAPFAPKMTIQVLLPGEKIKVIDTVRAIPLPKTLQPLMERHTDLAFFKSEIDRLSKYGDIVAGNKNKFDKLDGLYVIVLDAEGIKSILLYDKGNYTNTATGSMIHLPDYAGKKILWVKVQ